ncbi:DNA-binding NarL/FixJ family response regulator [Streptosporangium album]|uniref:DNA-binding NarL/FixJ family response regulator n=1 Tax=Streptosporangium album TaxID=47479 RepID=A0A7W7RZC4_9ACTN|nr:LuxR C-terminal-related transcriptional regulator [Streptosporangium album]MBB4941049.1 DNA-binding NarL/FixJ family response regulator [Streptosporangium album]
MTPIRVVIADDQMMVRQGFTVLLNAEPGIEVVGQAVNGLDAVTKVAERLVVAEQTVKTRVSRILVRLGLRDRTQAAVYAYETGLVRPAGY